MTSSAAPLNSSRASSTMRGGGVRNTVTAASTISVTPRPRVTANTPRRASGLISRSSQGVGGAVRIGAPQYGQ